MRYALRTVSVMALLVFVLAGCQSLTGKTASETVDDASITAAVKTKLAGEKVSTLTKIDVDTNKGTVYLNGNVDTAAMKMRAAELARQVKGVREVVNNLKVSGG
ncbi:MAG TPA: BON domain-containing protein [Methylomirabilota bacterium]|jgi:osmotically-inducible protein OsmY|nr:BON domain-containing protein [Methylomirabilota bacterium]